MKYTAKDKTQALDTLSRCYPKGSTVYTILEGVSRSGMQAKVRVLSLNEKDYGLTTYFTHPNWAASVLTGYALFRGGYRDALKVNGCGFDRQEAVKEAIERALGYQHGDLNHESL